MNVWQIVKKARLNADAIRFDKSVTSLWSDEEMIDLVNEVADHMAPHLRMSMRQYHHVRMLSTDNVTKILGQSYDPHALHLSDGAQFVTLPPDFVEVVRITPIVTSANPQVASVRFIPRDVNDPLFIEADIQAQQVQDTGGIVGRTGFMYDLVGPRTLRISPTVHLSDLDVELLYIAKKTPLVVLRAGTISISDNQVLGMEDSDDQDFTLVGLPCEVIPGVTGTEDKPSPEPEVDVNKVYPTVQTIHGPSKMTLAASTPNVTWAGYVLASVPTIPEEHHRWMASMVTDLMLRKVSSQLATERMNLTMAQWQGTVQPDLARPRQSQEPTYTAPYDAGA